MKPSNIYTSGPMRGYDGSNFPAFFGTEEWLHEQFPDAVIMNPAREDVILFGLQDLLRQDPTGLAAGRWLNDVIDFGEDQLRAVLAKDMAFIAEKADLLVMLDGWEQSSGARAEKALADAIGIPVVDYQSLSESLDHPRLAQDTAEGLKARQDRHDEALAAQVEALAALPPSIGDAMARFLDKAGMTPIGNTLDGDPVFAGPVAEGETRATSATGGQKGVKLAAFDQISPGILWELAEHFGRGAQKYAAHNFRKGYPWSQSFSALCRHLWEFWGGKEWDVCDEDCARPAPIGESEHGPTCYNHTGSRVIIAVIWHAMCLAEFSRYPQFKEYDDRYVYEDH